MNKRVTVGITAAFIFIAIAITFTATYIFAMNRYDQKMVGVQARAAMYDKLAEVDAAVRQNYVGEIDDDALKTGMIQGYLSGITDDSTRYVTAAQIAAIEAEQGGLTVGLGIFAEQNPSGYAVVKQIIPDSPADKIGMLPGDVIVAVKNLDALVVGYDEVIDVLTGPEGEQINITYSRDGVEQKVELIYTQVSRQSIITHTVNGYTYVRFTDFNLRTPAMFADMVNRMYLEEGGIRALVLDLRDLDGGYCLEGVEQLLEQLMPAGVIVAADYGKTGSEIIYESENEEGLTDVPAVVLVNEKTRGLSELMAACLGTRVNVSVIGMPSAGAGRLQRLFRLSDGSGVYVSVCKLLGAGSVVYDQTGVSPDFQVQAGEDFVLTDGEPNLLSDIQLRKALEVLDTALSGDNS